VIPYGEIKRKQRRIDAREDMVGIKCRSEGNEIENINTADKRFGPYIFFAHFSVLKCVQKQNIMERNWHCRYYCKWWQICRLWSNKTLRNFKED
jgi:hypothetical protein